MVDSLRWNLWYSDRDARDLLPPPDVVENIGHAGILPPPLTYNYVSRQTQKAR